MSRSRVAVLSTTPETVGEDFGRLLSLVSVSKVFAADAPLYIAPDLCRNDYFPSTGTTPWQLDGVLGVLERERIATDSRTLLLRDAPGITGSKAVESHALSPVLRRHKLGSKQLTEQDAVAPPGSFSDDPISPALSANLRIPECLRGASLLLLPALRTRPGFVVGGALATFAQLVLPELPSLSPVATSQLLAQLARLRRHAAPRTMAVIDATICGDGAGPRGNRPSIQNVLIASSDPIAADAVAARLMGFDPMHIEHLHVAAGLGAGAADPADIEVVGEDIAGIDFGLRLERNLGNLGEAPVPRPLRGRALSLYRGARLANFYERCFWYPFQARASLRTFRRTPWGQLFSAYKAGTIST